MNTQTLRNLGGSAFSGGFASLLILCSCAVGDPESDELRLEDELDAAVAVESAEEDDDPDADVGRIAPERFVEGNAHGERVIVGEDGGAMSIVPEAAKSFWADAEDVAARQRDTAGAVASAPRSRSSRALHRAASLASSDVVRVIVRIEAPTFDFGEVRTRTGASRRELLADRTAQVAAAQASAESELLVVGATVLSRSRLMPSFEVEIAASAVPELEGLSVVRSVHLDDTPTTQATYEGDDIRENTLTEDLLSAGYDSFQGSAADGGRVRIGVLEVEVTGTSNWPTQAHVGWDTCNGCSSRLEQVYDCRPGSCVATNNTANGSTHGNAVMWAAGGDITDGQDPTIASATDRIRRSGVAPESELYYYGADSCTDINDALEQAIADDVDVINMSFGWEDSWACDTTLTCMDANLIAARDAGILLVAAAGNEGNAGGCNQIYPSFRPEVLAVGSLNSDDSTPYEDMSLLTTSSHGPVPITLRTGAVRDTAGIDLTAPGRYRRYFTSANNYSFPTISGTSMASPIVAGTAANMRDMFDSIGWAGAVNEAEPLLVNMLLLGDNWDFNTDDDRRTGISDFSGFGRLRAHFPSNANLDGPWGWGWRAETILQGQTKTWTVGGAGVESNWVDEFKWAVTWFDDELDEVSDVVISVYNTCPAGGGTQYVAGDGSYNIRKAIHLLAAEIGGRCLEMRATAYVTPPGGVTIYSADYWHGGDISEH